MTNSDTKFGVHNKQTVILSQPYDGSTALTTFASVEEAKAFYFTTTALSVIDECATQLQWAVVNDDRDDATSLKRTMAFGIIENASTEQWAAKYNRRLVECDDAGTWGNTQYTTTDSSDHLF